MKRRNFLSSLLSLPLAAGAALAIPKPPATSSFEENNRLYKAAFRRFLDLYASADGPAPAGIGIGDESGTIKVGYFDRTATASPNGASALRRAGAAI